MKARKFLIVALALSMATVACSQNNAKLPDGTSAKDLLPSKAQIDSVSYLLGINFGSFLKSYDFGGDLNYAEMKKGILDFLGAEGDQTDSNFVKQFKVNPELMNDVFNGFLDKRAAYNALARFDVSPALMTKLWGKYGGNAGDVLEKNPYDIMEIEGIGFAAADRIARARPLEIPLRDPRRMRAAVLYVIDSKLPSGNTYNTIPAFIDAFIKTTKSSSDEAIRYIRECNGKSIVISNGRIYRKNLYDAEVALAQSLSAIASGKRHCVTVSDTDIEMTEEKLSDESHSPYRYNALQREAIRKAGKSSLLVLTGGPGTGKTTALRGMIECLMRHRIKKDDILLAAPTGKAAQRMTESVGIKGLKGMTIHRMLGYDGKGFSVDELHGKVLIVDETSMLDVLLARSLFKRIPSGMKVILVGDPDQLPSVQAGNVLGDIIGSGRFPHVHLTEIMRQANGSPIPDAARAVISGDYPSLAKVIDESMKTNDGMPAFVLHRIRELMDEHGLTDTSRVGLYGLTYKENVDDMRDSPTLQLLESQKEHLKVYDPFITKDVVPNQVHDLDDFLDSCDLVVIMVKHNEIRENADKLKGKIVLDCHNILDLPGVYHI